MSTALTARASIHDPQPVCLWRENSNRLVSLLDMVRYAIRELHTLLLWMDRMVKYTRGQETSGRGIAALLSGEQESVLKHTISIREHCEEMELSDASSACDELINNLGNMTLGECRGHVSSIRRMLTDAIENRVFMYIPLRLAEYAKPVKLPRHGAPSDLISIDMGIPYPLWKKPFGNQVFLKFTDARYDCEQVALCIVAGASTAAVFHMMRVVEWGIRDLGKDLKIRRIKITSKSKVIGKLQQSVTKLIPIENATWEMIHNQLRVKIDRRLAKLRPGPSKDTKAIFYSSILHDFHGFREAWRNHVMHTRENFKEREALRVLPHVRRFMNLLASHTAADEAIE